MNHQIYFRHLVSKYWNKLIYLSFKLDPTTDRRRPPPFYRLLPLCCLCCSSLSAAILIIYYRSEMATLRHCLSGSHNDVCVLTPPSYAGKCWGRWSVPLNWRKKGDSEYNANHCCRWPKIFSLTWVRVSLAFYYIPHHCTYGSHALIIMVDVSRGTGHSRKR